jgi:nucleoside-diphosphate kinase
LVALKLVHVSKELAEKHYEEHKEKKFFGELVEFMISGPVIAMIWEGKSVIKSVRLMVGSTSNYFFF